MRSRLFLLATVLVALTATLRCQARDIKFSGHNWSVRSTGSGGPGPNRWNEKNVSVDSEGSLHLKLTHQQGAWECAEVSSTEKFGFGTYQFQVIGRPDQWDPNIVLGLFNYPTKEVGPDGTHEIDIELSRWGHGANPAGNYVVYPTKMGQPPAKQTFPIKLTGDYTTHRFLWTADRVAFQSLYGHRDNNELEFARWNYQPEVPSASMGQKPMPVHINLWCADGKPPKNGRELEVVIRSFKFTKP